MTITLLVVFGVIEAILVLMHAATYQALAAAFNLNWPWLAWLFGLLSVTFVTSSLLAHRFCNGFVRWYYRISMYWFGLIIFLTEGTFLFFFVAYGLYSFNIYVSPALLGTICLGGMFVVHCWATWETTRIKVKQLEISLPNLPEFWKNKKIVFVSDVHLGAVNAEGFATKVAKVIGAQSPEMILIGGDIFDGVKCHADSMLKPFTDLRPPQGTYFASGNHEYIEDTESMLRGVKNAGMRILANESVDVHGLQIVGVDWKDTHHDSDFEKALTKIKLDAAKPSILMRHEPNHLDVAARAGVSLTLCGHTHAGQIWPLEIITGHIYGAYDYGLHPLGKMMVATSSGVGTWGPPLRFLTPSEILVITLK